MPINSISKWDTYQRINFYSYTDTFLSLSFNTIYSIVLIEHYGDIVINYEHKKLHGHYLIFLCPGETLEVDDYDKLNLITIPNSFKITKNKNFIYNFGNVKKYFQLGLSSFLKINILFKELQEIFYHNKNTDNLQHILSDILEINLRETKIINAKEHILAYNFISLVHEHYKMHHEMSFYSKKLVTTPKYITEKFYSLGILPPHEFIKKRILVEAKRQLLHTEKTAKMICFDIGFNDSAYFARFFKKNTGITTKKFKELYKRIE